MQIKFWIDDVELSIQNFFNKFLLKISFAHATHIIVNSCDKSRKKCVNVDKMWITRV